MMGEGSVSKALFRLGVPMVFSMVVMALYNVVDTYFVSGLGTVPVAAVSVAFPFSLLFTGIGLSFGFGSGSFISRFLGSGDPERSVIYASTAVVASGAVAGIIAVAFQIFLPDLLEVAGARGVVLPVAMGYGRWFSGALVISAVNVALGNVTVSQGAPVMTLTAMSIGALSNMVLDPLFIYVFGFGVRGAAIATVLSQFLSLGLYVRFYRGPKTSVNIDLSRCSTSVGDYVAILKIGLSMFVSQILSALSMALISNKASLYGPSGVAAMGVVLRIVALGSFVVFGFVKGLQPLAGYSYGAGNGSRVRKAEKVCLIWTTSFCLLWMGVIAFFGNQVMSWFSTDPSVLKIGRKALQVQTLLFFTFGFQFTYATLCLALGHAREGTLLTVSRQGLFLIPTLILLHAFFGLDGVIYSQAVADVLATLLTVSLIMPVRKEVDAMIRVPRESHV